MSPEQLEGKDADARADIWALGCVLYEMATGQRAFTGKNQASLISAIMTSEPQSISKLQPMTPPALERLVKVCLAKDPDDRLQTAHDVMQELKWIAEGAAPAAAAMSVRGLRERLLWAGGLLATAFVAWFAGSAGHHAPQAARAIQFDIRPPEGTELQPYLAVAPDGTRIAFTSRDAAGVHRLFVYALSTGETKAIVGTDGATAPFWSPDSRSVGFHVGGLLKRVEIDGGVPQTITAVLLFRGANWRRDGWIVFAADSEAGLSRVRASGGSVEDLTRRDVATKETSHRFPHSLPDGRLLYLALTPGAASIVLREPDGSGSPKRILEEASGPIFDSGHLLYVRDGALRAQAFDTATASLTGEPVTLAQDIARGWDATGGIPVAAAGGVLAFRSGRIGDHRLTWFDRNGQQHGTLGPPEFHQEPVFSPDGRSVAAILGTGDTQFLGIVDVASGALQRLTFGKELQGQPCWSPDGRFLAYSANRSGTYDIYMKSVSGTGSEETLVQTGRTSACDDVSRDGRVLLYDTKAAQSQVDLWILPLTGERKAVPFVSTEADELQGAFSPDGRFVAYASNTTGRPEVYVRAFPGGEGPWQVSSAGGYQPRWRRDGRELFYVSPDGHLMVASVKGGASFAVDRAKPLFALRTLRPNLQGNRNDYDVTPDGQRFLANELAHDPAKATITVVVNWTSKLER